jgi:hypothetical protein
LGSFAGTSWADEHDVQCWLLGAFVSAFQLAKKILNVGVPQVAHL